MARRTQAALDNARRLAERLNRQSAIDAVKFYYFKDECTSAYRVWQVGTPGDVFDVIPYDTQDIRALLHFFEGHPDMFVQGEPPED